MHNTIRSIAFVSWKDFSLSMNECVWCGKITFAKRRKSNYSHGMTAPIRHRCDTIIIAILFEHCDVMMRYDANTACDSNPKRATVRHRRWERCEKCKCGKTILSICIWFYGYIFSLQHLCAFTPFSVAHSAFVAYGEYLRQAVGTINALRIEKSAFIALFCLSLNSQYQFYVSQLSWLAPEM